MPNTPTLSPGDLAAHLLTLTANTVDAVTFADDCDEVEVLTLDGTARIFLTVDGSAPTVGGAHTYVIPAIAGASVRVSVPTAAGTVVKLISTGTPKYSVTRTA